MDLKQISRLAKERFPFDRQHYPDFPLEPEAQALFARRHILLHMAKNVGQIAGALESGDHGNVSDTNEAVATLRKMLVNAIRFADVSGIPLEVIERDIVRWASE